MPQAPRMSGQFAEPGQRVPDRVWSERTDRQLETHTKIEADGDESDNNARKSEGENVAHVVSRDAASGLSCGYGDRLHQCASCFTHRILLLGLMRHSRVG
jgi:hypothetical protein